MHWLGFLDIPPCRVDTEEKERKKKKRLHKSVNQEAALSWGGDFQPVCCKLEWTGVYSMNIALPTFYSRVLNSQSSRSATTKWNYTGMNQPFRLPFFFFFSRLTVKLRLKKAHNKSSFSLSGVTRLMTALLSWMFTRDGNKYVPRIKSHARETSQKIPWSKSVGLNWRSVPVVQIPPSHLGSFQLIAA